MRCFSAARETGFGKKGNRADKCYGSERCAWIAMRMRCWFASKQSGPVFVMKVTGAAFFENWSRTGAPRSSRNAPLRRKKFTDRRKRDEPAEAGNPKRQLAGSHAGSLCACRMEDHAGLAKLRSGNRRRGNRVFAGPCARDGALR